MCGARAARPPLLAAANSARLRRGRDASEGTSSADCVRFGLSDAARCALTTPICVLLCSRAVGVLPPAQLSGRPTTHRHHHVVVSCSCAVQAASLPTSDQPTQHPNHFVLSAVRSVFARLLHVVLRPVPLLLVGDTANRVD